MKKIAPFIFLLVYVNLAFAQQQKTIVIFGNSLTAGMGVQPEQAFPALIQNKIDQAGFKYKVVNAGLSGETTAGGVSRINWILKNNDIDIFVLELGANDGLRGIPLAQTRQNLKTIIEKVRASEAEVEIILTGMQVPPNMGEDYANEFKSIFPDIAKEKNVELVPFLLEGVGGEKKLNQSDGIHPNPEGHKILAENVWQVLKPLLIR
ncbi:MAG: arylesterase [Cyclobacteriaceae bacterium]